MENNNQKKETLKFIITIWVTTIFGVASLTFALVTYFESKELKEINERILVQVDEANTRSIVYGDVSMKRLDEIYNLQIAQVPETETTEQVPETETTQSIVNYQRLVYQTQDEYQVIHILQKLTKIKLGFSLLAR